MIFHRLPSTFFAFLAVALVGATAFGDSQPPRLRLSEVESIQPTSYQVDLTLDPTKDDLQGSISIQMDIQQPTQTIWLNQERLSIQSATLTTGGHSMTLTAIPGGDNFVGFQSKGSIPSGKAELKIAYTGTVITKDSSGVFRQQDEGNWYAFTQFEPTDARAAFPCFDEPTYKTPWQLTLHVPSSNSAISNTRPASDKVGGNTRTVVFNQTKPLPSYLVAFAVGPFEYVPAGFTQMTHAPIRIVVPKGRADEAKYAAQVTAGIINHHEKYFGIPYPYEKADQVAVPDTSGWGAMENPGMVTYGLVYLLSKPASDTIERQRVCFETAAHELAHQWFGDLVTTAWWNDIWLNEAFATWFERKTTVEMHPEWETKLEQVSENSRTMGEDSLTYARKIRQPIESVDDISNAFDGITYQKGAAVIGMFEHWISAPVFQQGVHNYLSKYAWRATTADDFLSSLDATAKKDVKTPFSSFLNQSGVPLVSAELKCDGKEAMLHLSQQRFLPVGSKGSTDQTWGIPVCASDSNGASECTLLDIAAKDWRLRAQGCPAWLDANANADGYYRTNYSHQLLNKLTEGDVQHRLNGAERAGLLGDTHAIAIAGKLPVSDALSLVPAFHNDAEREVVSIAADLAGSIRMNLVPENLEPNYQRFLMDNFGQKARELGWVPKPGESDNDRLLRSQILPMVATNAGDQQLAKQGEALANEWLQNHNSVTLEMLGPVLSTAAYYGDKSLFEEYLTAYHATEDKQMQLRLMWAMHSFRDPDAIRAAYDALATGKIPFIQGEYLLFTGTEYRSTRTLALDLMKEHWEAIKSRMPEGFGFTPVLPRVGATFCSAESREQLFAFFQPKLKELPGAERTLNQVLEGIDLCMAEVQAQQASVTSFLEKYAGPQQQSAAATSSVPLRR